VFISFFVFGTLIEQSYEIYQKIRAMKIASSLIITLLFVTNFCFSQNKIQTAIDNFVKYEGLQNASISIKVVDLNNGNTVGAYNSNLSLPTASTAKLFSTATALELLGPNYTASTRMYIDGEIDSLGVLHGNVWIRGGGDPTNGSKYYNKEGLELQFLNEFVDALAELKISKIEGNVIGDASEFGYQGAPDGWVWGDLGNYYGAGPSGLTIYDNLLRYRFSSSSKPNVPAKLISIEPKVPGLTYQNYVRSSYRKGDHVYLYGAPYALDRFGSGTLPVGQSNFLVKGSLPDPELQFAHELVKAIESKGISISKGAQSARLINTQSNNETYKGRTLVYTKKSYKLIDIITLTNFRSINLFAEHMINLIGFEKTGNGSTYKGLDVLKNFWDTKLSSKGLFVADGSGLSRTNAISANHFTQMLSYMNKSKNGAAFKKSLPVAGESGTMRNVCKGQAGHGHIAAKSGSMNRIRSYAGYASTNTGKELAFAIIVNNNTCSSTQLRLKMQTLMNQIASY
jgi:D-alanyl-D-alanine carboxypeptidase/D-alanyl-D-alanine-endopeptidase (penicillin-binding protein 4)